jgi:uncharacterized protein (TIGR00369 family)
VHKQPNSRHCFVCGLDNDKGLHLSFYDDGENRVMARLVPGQEHQGYPGVLHGGIISALLDETIGRVLVQRDIWAMTAELKIRFLKPVPLEQPITVIGEMVRLRSRTLEGKGEIRLADGTLAVSAEAKYILLPPERTEQFREELGYWGVVPDEDERANPESS